MPLFSYNSSKITVVCGGNVIGGFADGTGVSVMRNNDMWTLTVGMGGYGSRAKSNDASGRITFTLQQTSQSNDILSAFAAADEQTDGGLFPVLLRDTAGRTFCSTTSAWVVKLPQVDFAKELSTREWVIETDKLSMLVGGN